MGLLGKCSGTSNLNIAAVPVVALVTRVRGVGVEGGVSGVLKGASHHSLTLSFGVVARGDLVFSLVFAGPLLLRLGELSSFALRGDGTLYGEILPPRPLPDAPLAELLCCDLLPRLFTFNGDDREVRIPTFSRVEDVSDGV